MADSFLGYDNKARQLDRAFVGVQNKARLCVKGYVGVNGVARLIYPHNNIIIPTLSGTYPYNGQEQGVTINNLNPYQVTASGETKSKDIGTHTVTFSLKPPFTKWSDNSTGNKTATWTIDPMPININHSESSGGTTPEWGRTSGTYRYTNGSVPPDANVSFSIKYLDWGWEGLQPGQTIYFDLYDPGNYRCWCTCSGGNGAFDLYFYRKNPSYNYDRLTIIVKVKDNTNNVTYQTSEIKLEFFIHSED